MVVKGVYLVRFLEQQDRVKACDMNEFMFDKKPFIVKPWVASMSYEKEHLSTLPIQTRFSSLDVMYWGERSLGKIAGMLGEVKRFDTATTNKARGMFARVLIDMSNTNDFPDELCYENEHGELVTKAVTYDWKPLWCKKCEQLGYVEEHCKTVLPSTPKIVAVVDNKGFQLIQSRTKSVQQGPPVRPLIPTQSGLAGILATGNGFNVLDSAVEGIETVEEEPNKGAGGFPIHGQ